MVLEEILGSNSAVWFSPDGSKLLYATFNDTAVEKMAFPVYGNLDKTQQYTKFTSISYPKVSFISSKYAEGFNLLKVIWF